MMSFVEQIILFFLYNIRSGSSFESKNKSPFKESGLTINKEFYFFLT